MYEGPEFRHLITFVAIAEECSFNRAAERLHITQPALTNHIKHLEDGLGASLFKRVPAGAELTETGRKFLPVARQILHMRQHAVRAASRSHADVEWPLRLGYSPYMNHDLLVEGLNAYKEIVPDGRIVSSSDCTLELIEMMHDGRLDAAIVTLPAPVQGFSQHFVCEDNVMICLRKDDPAAAFDQIPRDAVAENLRIMFNRHYHPDLHDYVFNRFKKVGVVLHPSESYSAPSEMQFLVKTRKCFGLVRESTPLDPELTMRPIDGMTLRFTTVLICRREQQRPVLPMLAYRMSQRCSDQRKRYVRKKPSGSLREAEGYPIKKVS